jgi:2-polyprenyl-3-methyl-5-hydroxy-6-metoxy-1,4-benzoquinol methylase
MDKISFEEGLVSDEIAQELLKLSDEYLFQDDTQENWRRMCRVIDIVWNDIGCSNTDLQSDANKAKISQFYGHPIWILNGLFSEQDETSISHRKAIANWIHHNELTNVLDFGGGFGTAARMIAALSTRSKIDVYEPYPSEYSLAKNEGFTNITFIKEIDRSYDCIVCLDVLEHVYEPLKVLEQIVSSINDNKFLIIANHFYPSIECHLPHTFHLRYTFNIFAKIMGLEVISPCGGSHAFIYKKTRERTVSWQFIHLLESFSKLIFPINEFLDGQIKIWKYRYSVLIQGPTFTLKVVKNRLLRNYVDQQTKY